MQMSELPPRRSRAAPKKYDDYEQMDDDDDDDVGMTSSSLKVKTTVGGVKPPAPARKRPLAVANAPPPPVVVVDTRADTKEEAALLAKYAQLREQARAERAAARVAVPVLRAGGRRVAAVGVAGTGHFRDFACAAETFNFAGVGGFIKKRHNGRCDS